MTWKFCGVLCLVCSVLLLWTWHLKKQNETLTIQNCMLQKTIEENTKAFEDKQKRDQDELVRLHKTLTEIQQLDPTWNAVPIPRNISARLYQFYEDSRSTVSAATATENSL